MLRNTHKKQRSKLRVLPGPICCRLVGAVGTGSLLLPPAEGVSSSSLMITERRTSVVLYMRDRDAVYLETKSVLACGG